VTAADTGRRMDVLTDQPGMQVYSANFLTAADLPLRGNRPQEQRAAICLETQHFPDTPNKPEFPTTLVSPGEKLFSATEYRFSAK
jgi:aldose 1-epimerase